MAKHIKLFKEFSETPVYNLDILIQGLIKTIKGWFSKGLFFKEGISLLYIEPSKMTDILEKNIIFNFTDQQWYYQAILIVPMVKENEEIKKAKLLVKKYSMTEANPEESISGPLVDQIDQQIDDIQTEFIGTDNEEGAPGEMLIMDMITKMSDEPKSPGTVGFKYQENPEEEETQTQF